MKKNGGEQMKEINTIVSKLDGVFSLIVGDSTTSQTAKIIDKYPYIYMS
ncbi:hypothetical protein ACFLTT_01755 [Chloroflexota bacterium]